MAGPLRRQVRSETRLRYGGSLADLLSARRTAHHQYQRDVDAAVESAGAIKQASRQAIPELKRIYNEADKTRSAAAEQIDQAVNLAGTPHGALAQALMGERGAAQTRFAEERAAAQSENVSRGRDAAAGLAFQKRNALDNYRSTRADLMAKTRDVHREMGAFAQGRLGELQQQQAQTDYQAQKDAQAQANSDRTYNLDVAKVLKVNPLTGKPLPQSATRTPSEQRQVAKDTADARDEVSLARTWLQRLRSGKNAPPLPQVASLLKTGGSIPVPTGQKDAQGQPKFRQVTVPAIKSDFLRAAVELETRGYLSQTSVHALRTTRNVHIPKEWLPVKVKFHYRRPKSTGGGYADVNLPAGTRG